MTSVKAGSVQILSCRMPQKLSGPAYTIAHSLTKVPGPGHRTTGSKPSHASEGRAEERRAAVGLGLSLRRQPVEVVHGATVRRTRRSASKSLRFCGVHEANLDPCPNMLGSDLATVEWLEALPLRPPRSCTPIAYTVLT